MAGIGPAAARVRQLVERADTQLKAASNRADPDVAHVAVRALLDEAMVLVDAIDDPAERDPLVVLVGRRVDDLNVLVRGTSRAPADHRGVRDLPQPGAATLAAPERSGAARLPPNQRLVRGFPVLHVGRVPQLDADAWQCTVTGAVRRRPRLGWHDLAALPVVEDVSDFHCVTGWSRLDNTWRGVRLRAVLDLAGPTAAATHVVVYGANAYSANLDLATARRDDVLLATHLDGVRLSAEHGGPVRLVVPSRYGWKSVKWVESVQLLEQDVPGWWEARGYHNVADPFLEQRYA